jgi:thiol-disulfide isomerase/thioredoxin
MPRPPNPFGGGGRPNPFGGGDRPNPFGGGGIGGGFKLRKTKKPPADDTKRPPAKVGGITAWFNLPEAVTASASPSGDLELSALFTGDVKLLLVDFFAYSCTNCLRANVVLKRWNEEYSEHGLRIVAFHRPEFKFEHSMFNMRDYIVRNKIEYTVGLDNNDQAWNDWKVDVRFLSIPSLLLHPGVF